MDNQRDNSIELSLPDMFWQFLSCWKKVLALMLIIGVLAGAIRLVVGIVNINDPEYLEKIEDRNQLIQHNYDVSLKATEQKVENTKLSISKKEEADKNAVMLRIDPYNTYVKYVIFFIKTDYQIMPEMSYQNPNYTNTITNGYINAIRNINLDEGIKTAEEPDLTVQNPFFDSQYSLLTVGEESGGGLIYVTIKGDTKERVETMFSWVWSMMEEHKALMEKSVYDHELSVLSETDDVIAEPDLRTLQNNYVENYSALTEELSEAEDMLEDLQENPPVLTGTGFLPQLISAVKFGIIGGIAGLLIGFIIWGLMRCLRGRVNSVEELRSKYEAVLLAAIPKDGLKRGKLERKAFLHLGIRKKLDYKSGVDLAAANLDLYLPKANDLLLIGTVEDDILSKLKDDLEKKLPGRKLQVGGDVNVSAAAVKAIEEEHTVICVEELNESRYVFINHELDAIDKVREQAVYFIVLG